MPRLYSDLLDASNRRYYFGLNSAPGGITNAAPAILTISGNAATIQELTSVFRTPATAVLTLSGQLASAEPKLQPATAVLSMNGLIPGMLKTLVISNALPPDYTDLPENVPTIVFIQTIGPGKATLVLNYPAPNVTQGGNIGFISPTTGTLTLQGITPAFPKIAEVGALQIVGLTPTLALTELVVSPETGTIYLSGLLPEASVPFTWVDEDRQPATSWIEDPRA